MKNFNATSVLHLHEFYVQLASEFCYIIYCHQDWSHRRTKQEDIIDKDATPYAVVAGHGEIKLGKLEALFCWLVSVNCRRQNMLCRLLGNSHQHFFSTTDSLLMLSACHDMIAGVIMA